VKLVTDPPHDRVLDAIVDPDKPDGAAKRLGSDAIVGLGLDGPCVSVFWAYWHRSSV